MQIAQSGWKENHPIQGIQYLQCSDKLCPLQLVGHSVFHPRRPLGYGLGGTGYTQIWMQNQVPCTFEAVQSLKRREIHSAPSQLNKNGLVGDGSKI